MYNSDCKIKKSNKMRKEIQKKAYQSWGQLTEYRNVEMAEDMARYAQQGGLFWSFPYVRQVVILSWVFVSSLWQCSKKSRQAHESIISFLTSDYMVMNMFVWAMTCLEYLTKALVSACLVVPSLFFTRPKLEFSKYMAQQLDDYACFLHKTPWFEFDFNQRLQDIDTEYHKICGQNKTWGDYFQKCFVSVDWQIKALLAPWIKKQFPCQDQGFVGTGINYATSKDGQLIRVPVYRPFTHWLKAAYKLQKDEHYEPISALDSTEEYDKPTLLQSLWGQSSVMCRVQLKAEYLKQFKDRYSCYVVSHYNHGVGDRVTVVLDIPWQAQWTKQADSPMVISTLLHQEPNLLDVHFHDHYAPPAADVVAQAHPCEVIAQQYQQRQALTSRLYQFFSKGWLAPMWAHVVVSYDKARPQTWWLRALGHITVLPVLGSILAAAVLLDAASWALVQVIGLVWGVLASAFKHWSEPTVFFATCWTNIKHGFALYPWKNIFRLPFVLFNPSYLSNCLISQPKKVTSGGGLYKCEVKVTRPRTLEELQTIVRYASKHNTNGRRISVSVVGAGNSQGQQFVTSHHDGEPVESVVLDLSELHLDALQGQKAVCAGGSQEVLAHAQARWHEVQDAIAAQGYALPVMQASNIFSVGGSVSTNIHGWNHHMGSLSNHIASMQVMNEEGEVIEVQPGSDLFSKIVGGYGRFGIILTVTLRVIDNIQVQLDSDPITLGEYIDYFTSQVKNNTSIAMHVGRLPIHDVSSWMRDDCKMISSLWKKSADATATCDYNLPREKAGGKVISQVLLNAMMCIKGMKHLFWKREMQTETTEKHDPISLDSTMNFPIHPMLRHGDSSEQYWLQEYFLPQDGIIEFTKVLGKILVEADVSLINASIRFVKAEEHKTALPYAAEDRYALVLCWKQPMREHAIDNTRVWVQKAIDAALDRGGTYYLPYQSFATQGQFDRAYPMARGQAMELSENDEKHSIFNPGISLYTQRPTQGVYRLYSDIDNMRGFFDVVFKQYDFDRFRAAMSRVMSQSFSSEEKLYQALQKGVATAFKGVLWQIQALRDLQDALGSQAKRILDVYQSGQSSSCQNEAAQMFNNEDIKALEIGTYNRYGKSLREKGVSIGSTDIFAPAEGLATPQMIVEQRSLSPLWKQPYSQHTTMDYQDVTHAGLAENSYDIIYAFAGLHHFKEDQVDDFLKTVYGALKVGGVFLVVEHDHEEAQGADTAAHSIFNLGTGVPYHEDKDELRFFKSIDTWEEKIGQAGFFSIKSDENKAMRCQREGDPSKNTMVGFYKPRG